MLNKQYKSNFSSNIKLEKSSKLKDKLENIKKLSKDKSLNFLNNKSSSFTKASEKVSTKNVSWGTWAVVWTNYISELWCFSYTPFYYQSNLRYNSYVEWWVTHNERKLWPSGCVPTAFSILYWYYDRNWRWDFIPWEFARARNNATIRDMQRTLWTIMWTKLESQPDGSFAAWTYSDRYIDGVNYLNNLYPKTQEISEIFDIDNFWYR